MKPIMTIARTTRMLPTTLGNRGTPAPRFTLTGDLRPALPLPAPAAAFARDLVAITPGRMPSLTFLASAGLPLEGRARPAATLRPGAQPTGRRVPVARLRDSFYRLRRPGRQKRPGRGEAGPHAGRGGRGGGRAAPTLGETEGCG